MLSKSKIKLINSLFYKKYRDQLGLFVVEGGKSVLEMNKYFQCKMLFAESDWNGLKEIKAAEIIEVNENELKKISFLKTPQKVLGVFAMPVYKYTPEIVKNLLSLALDNVQDPGNLGTIIRIADWFGIKNIFCSADTADVYNPKTVQATMGALGRVQVHYVNLHEFINGVKTDVPVFGTFLDGDNIYEKQLPNKGLIVMGNEGNGISEKISGLVSHKLLIPSFPSGAETSESLNVAVATAIICSEFRRR